jgi:hypothetical protein
MHPTSLDNLHINRQQRYFGQQKKSRTNLSLSQSSRELLSKGGNKIEEESIQFEWATDSKSIGNSALLATCGQTPARFPRYGNADQDRRNSRERQVRCAGTSALKERCRESKVCKREKFNRF